MSIGSCINMQGLYLMKIKILILDYIIIINKNVNAVSMFILKLPKYINKKIKVILCYIQNLVMYKLLHIHT